MRIKLLLPLAFCLLCNTLWAQHTISGTVTDAKTGETLIGATIYDTLSHKGTVTNQHGRYSLTLKDDKAVSASESSSDEEAVETTSKKGKKGKKAKSEAKKAKKKAKKGKKK